MAEQGLTEQQKKWMASVRTSLPEKTGRSMAEWVEIARACPETAPRARQRWFKEHHGLGVNYFSFVEAELRGADGVNDPRDSGALEAALWSDPGSAAVFRAIETAVAEVSETVIGQRKGFTTFSRRFAFAAARPAKGGGVRLGLAVDPDADPRLQPPRSEGWSERLKAVLPLRSAAEVDQSVRALLRAAWEAS